MATEHDAALRTDVTIITVREREPRTRMIDTDVGPVWITLSVGDFIEVGELRIEVTEFAGESVRVLFTGPHGDNPA